MAKYRKKPVEIEAFICGSDDIPGWFNAALESGQAVAIIESGAGCYDNKSFLGGYKIKTLEGEMNAGIGDYIIKGVQGEIYPCRQDIFESTYEKIIETRNYKWDWRIGENHESLLR